MPRLRDDTFARRGRSAPRRRYVSALVFVLIFISITLLVLSRLDHPIVTTLRSQVTPVFTPILTALSGPLAPVRNMAAQIESKFISHDELTRLREENQRLKNWEWRARDLERQLASLSRIAKLPPLPNTPFLTARVVASASGPFSRSVIIDAGATRGIKNGHPVMNADGLIGRIVEVSPTASRILLIDDVDMRVPVMIGAENARAILVGNNSARPRVTHVKRGAQISAGDVVATSGRGGLFPRSMRVGTVVRDGRQFVVRSFADLARLDFVSVLLFDSPILSITSEARQSSVRRSGSRRQVQ
ncbi:MAG: rod shape-determining protein MreC [Pseudomonadota bacterium]